MTLRMTVQEIARMRLIARRSRQTSRKCRFWSAVSLRQRYEMAVSIVYRPRGLRWGCLACGDFSSLRTHFRGRLRRDDLCAVSLRKRGRKSRAFVPFMHWPFVTDCGVSKPARVSRINFCQRFIFSICISLCSWMTSTVSRSFVLSFYTYL